MSSSTEAAGTTTGGANAGTYRSVVAWIMIVVGALMMIGGIVAWFAVSANLRVENMTVPEDASSNAGKSVAGPLTAWSMQEIIHHHALTATDGLTYAELGDKVNEAKEQYGDDSDEAAAAQGLRNTAMNSSFLRGSLFTSILAFGVSALAFGTGLVSTLGGTIALPRGNKTAVAAAPPADE